MTAPAHFPRVVRLAPSWRDLVAIARRSVESTLATAVIEQLRVEAEALAAYGMPDRLINQAIADAAQSFCDCPCISCLDEIDMLMDDDVPSWAEQAESHREWIADMAREIA